MLGLLRRLSAKLQQRNRLRTGSEDKKRELLHA